MILEYQKLKRAEKFYNTLYKIGESLAFGGFAIGDVAIGGCIADFAGHSFFQDSTLANIAASSFLSVLFGGIIYYGSYQDRERCRNKLSKLDDLNYHH